MDRITDSIHLFVCDLLNIAVRVPGFQGMNFHGLD